MRGSPESNRSFQRTIVEQQIGQARQALSKAIPSDRRLDYTAEHQVAVTGWTLVETARTQGGKLYQDILAIASIARNPIELQNAFGVIRSLDQCRISGVGGYFINNAVDQFVAMPFPKITTAGNEAKELQGKFIGDWNKIALDPDRDTVKYGEAVRDVASPSGLGRQVNEYFAEALFLTLLDQDTPPELRRTLLDGFLELRLGTAIADPRLNPEVSFWKNVDASWVYPGLFASKEDYSLAVIEKGKPVERAVSPRTEIVPKKPSIDSDKLVGQLLTGQAIETPSGERLQPLNGIVYHYGRKLLIAGSGDSLGLTTLDIPLSNKINTVGTGWEGRILELPDVESLRLLPLDVGTPIIQTGRTGNGEATIQVAFPSPDSTTQPFFPSETQLLRALIGKAGGIKMFSGAGLDLEVALLMKRTVQQSKQALVYSFHPQDMGWNSNWAYHSFLKDLVEKYRDLPSGSHLKPLSKIDQALASGRIGKDVKADEYDLLRALVIAHSRLLFAAGSEEQALNSKKNYGELKGEAQARYNEIYEHRYFLEELLKGLGVGGNVLGWLPGSSKQRTSVARGMIDEALSDDHWYMGKKLILR